MSGAYNEICGLTQQSWLDAAKPFLDEMSIAAAKGCSHIKVENLTQGVIHVLTSQGFIINNSHTQRRDRELVVTRHIISWDNGVIALLKSFY